MISKCVDCHKEIDRDKEKYIALVDPAEETMSIVHWDCMQYKITAIVTEELAKYVTRQIK